MCAQHLAVIYSMYLARGLAPLVLLEAVLGVDGGRSVNEDDLRNAEMHYVRLFSGECLAFVQKLYADMMNRMRHCSYSEAAGPLAVLGFLQEVVATALWKYRVDAGEELTSFAREFDRLDLESERARLYALTNGA